MFIVSKSTDGQIRLGFSDNLLEVRDLDSMLTDRVAVPTDHANSETVVIFDRKKRTFFRSYIRNATEVQYLPAEQENAPVQLTDVRVQKFEQHQMTFQLHFDKPNEIDYEDLISVSFWKREMYMSKLTGAKIPFGTEIYVRIALQVTEATKSSLDKLISALAVLAVLALCSFVVVKVLVFRLINGGGGRGENMLMPIWMGLNSL